MPLTPPCLAPVTNPRLSLAALLITAAIGYAAPPPNPAPVPSYGIGDALKGATPPADATQKQPTSPGAPLLVPEGEKPLELPDEKKILIADFVVEDAEAADADKLAALLAPFKGKELSMKDINQVANKLTLYYRSKGYLVARVYVPKQDASQGRLLLRVLKGQYGRFTLKNRSRVKDSVLLGTLEGIKGSGTVTQAGLERAMMLVRDMPGGSTPMVSIAPGSLPGSSDFEVRVDPSAPYGGYLMADNQGSRNTGKDRYYVGVDLNSPLGLGDKLSVSAMTTEQTNLSMFRVAYGLPLGTKGLRGELAASHTKYTLGAEYAALDAVGTADLLEATLSYPLQKTRTKSLDLSLNLAYKHLRDDLLAAETLNPRRAYVATLNLQQASYGSLLGKPCFGSIGLSASLGTLEILDSTTLALNQAGADTEGRFSKANLSLAGSMDLSTHLSIKGAFKAQQVITAHNIDSSEQFFLSGTGGVRGFRESYGFDNGYLASAEVRYALPPLSKLKQTVGVFCDAGRAQAQKGSYTTIRHYAMGDAGLGYYLNLQPFFGALQVARAPWRSSGVQDPGTRFLIQIGASF